MAPWVLVAGGFHHRGGMDKANAELAACLLDSGAPVHLVGHEIEGPLRDHAGVVVHRVPRPAGMPAMADWLLARAGRRVAHRVTATHPSARVVVNGGNCAWPDVNWVHAVHAAWPVCDDGAAWWSGRRNARLKAIASRREREALQGARLVIANSEATRQALITRVGIEPRRISTIYLGSDPAWGLPTPSERAQARAALGVLHPETPVVVFVGTLGTDLNKGFDRLLNAWLTLARSGSWDARLIVAGEGWRRTSWARAVENAGVESVRFLGATDRIRDVLAAGDLLVSPVRYEAYGLNVHEALCRGLAVMVTRTAGIVERFDDGLREALLPQEITADDLAARMHRWRSDVEGWRGRARSTAERLRARSWRDMAAELVATVQTRAREVAA